VGLIITTMPFAQDKPDVAGVRKVLQRGARTVPELRPRLWRLLLLGCAEAFPAEAKGWSQAVEGLGELSINECHVLAVDVPRTRGDVAAFKTKDMHASLTSLLTRFCLAHGTRYRQGLNEVLAPFMALTAEVRSEAAGGGKDEGEGPSATFLSDRERYALFDAFVCKYLAAFYLDGDASPTFRQQQSSTGSPLGAESFSPEKSKTSATAAGAGSSGTSSTSFGAMLSAAAGGGSSAPTSTSAPSYVDTTPSSSSSSSSSAPAATAAVSSSPSPSSPPSGAGGGLRAHIASDGGLPLALRLFGVCLRFHDPSLAGQLEAGGVGPELYATPWLLTGLARGTPLPLVLELWDCLLATDDVAMLPLCCMELLRSKRQQLLLSEPQVVFDWRSGH
jgi:hypothetical protein